MAFYFDLTGVVPGVVALDGTDQKVGRGLRGGRAEVCFRNASRQMGRIVLGRIVLSWW